MKPQVACFASVFLAAALSACTSTDTVSTVEAVNAPGLTSPFTTNCKSIKLETKTAGQVSNFGTLSSSQTRISQMPGFPNGTTLTATCRDASGQATGSTTIDASSNQLTAGSSEGSTLTAEYAKAHTTTGVFPIVTLK